MVQRDSIPAFGRPRFSDLIDGSEFLFARGYIVDKECPARREWGEVPAEVH
jgi:hypothetical protein